MRKFTLALLLMQTTLIFAKKPNPSPETYPVTIHVIFSRYTPTYVAGATESNIRGAQQLQTIIDGQQIELLSERGLGVLAPGDYKAQLSRTHFNSKSFNSFDNFVVYRFLLPDGTTRDFDVVGLGIRQDASGSPAPSKNP